MANVILVSGIPYLIKFAEKYKEFDEQCIVERSLETAEKLKDIYLISIEDVKNIYSKLQIYFEMKKQLEVAFGYNSGYVKELEARGVDKFIQYVYSNKALPLDEVMELKNLLSQTA